MLSIDLGIFFQVLTDSITNETIVSSKNLRYLFIIRYLSLYALALIIVGTVGNILTIIVLLRRNLRRFVTARYLIIVSICDIISLYGWNLNNFYKFNISSRNGNIEDLSVIHCRVISFMTFVVLQLSSWCLTAVSLGKYNTKFALRNIFDYFFFINRSCSQPLLASVETIIRSNKIY